MLIEIGYHRHQAVKYAERWALTRNPDFLDFETLGGDCTNFASQCLFAGCQVMNDTKHIGWYYYSAANRAPAWTSVQHLYEFLMRNKQDGPYATEVVLSDLEIGDFVQMGRTDRSFYHTPVVTGFDDQDILVSAHSRDAFMRPLSSYEFDTIRGLHILGSRKYQ